MVSLIDTDGMIDLSRENAEAASYVGASSEPAISLIAATAMEQHEHFVTRNRKQFAMIEGLRFESRNTKAGQE